MTPNTAQSTKDAEPASAAAGGETGERTATDFDEINDAVSQGNLDKVRVLLKANPSLVLSKDKSGMTLLHWAATSAFSDPEGYRKVVKLLLANNADVNAKDNSGKTPLHYAAIGAYKGITELLLANKADVNAEDKSGNTPLDEALGVAHQDCGQADCVAWEVAKTLYRHGGRQNSSFPPVRF